jgi:acyl transferase domain-containing protein
MSDTFATPSSPIAVVGVGAIMPDAPDADTFWANITGGRYSITDVPPERWDPALYYSSDHAEPDKTYSTIGGWVRDFPWDPASWKLPIPPKVADQMDDGQRWAIAAARAALVDAGWPDWKTDPDNVAVIIGNAIGGEKHYQTNMRIELPEVLRDLQDAESFASLPTEQRQHIIDETRSHFLAHYGEINEDTMPGELANVMAGRIANLFNFRGPNFTTDAACASGLAAMSVAVDGLVDHRFDAAITGGIDHNMGVAAFVKFCKIGALSATGTRPFDAGADGFVMGRAPHCSCSSGSRTPSVTATGSTPSSSASPDRATARARESPRRIRSVSALLSNGRGAPLVRIREPSTRSRRTAPRPGWVMRPSCRASPTSSLRPGPGRAASRSVR